MFDKANMSAIYRDDKGEITINLQPLLKAIFKKIWLVILVAAVVAAATYVGTKRYVDPVYRTYFTVYVNNKTDIGETTILTSSDVTAARSLASTYAEVINGQTVLLLASQGTPFEGMSYDQLKSLVEAKTSNSTEIITVYVKGDLPETALEYAESIAKVAEMRISGIVDGSSMRVIDEPLLPKGIYSPSYTKVAVIAGIIAALIICAIIVINEMLNDNIKGEASLEENFKLPVLGSIPNFDDATKHRRYGYYGYGYSRSYEQASQRAAEEGAY